MAERVLQALSGKMGRLALVMVLPVAGWLLMLASFGPAATAFAQDDLPPPCLPATDWPAQVITDGQLCVAMLPYISYRQPAPFPQLVNGNFEQGPNMGWTERVNQQPGQLVFARQAIPNMVLTGNNSLYIAWLGGYTNTTNLLTQVITLSVDYQPGLRLRYYTLSDEQSCTRDTATVAIGAQVIKQYALCAGQATQGWRNDLIDLAPFRGQRVELRFETVLDGKRLSSWFLDDIVLCTDDTWAPLDTPRCTL